jgi:hypothetical protein
MKYLNYSINRFEKDNFYDYSTVTDLARLRGWSILQPFTTAM